MRHAATLIALLALAGCKESIPTMPTMPMVVEVEVVKYVPVPHDLSKACQHFTPNEQSYNEAKRLAEVRRLAAIECDDRMTKIRNLPTTPETRP